MTDPQPSRRNLLVTLPAVGAGLSLPALAAVAAQPGAGGVPEGRLPPKLTKVLEATHSGDQYALPPLPYAYDALEPHIDEQTMRLHHDLHHQGYVDGLNKTVAAMTGDVAEKPMLAGLDRDLSFNYAGHLLHSIFWATMGPGEDGKMGGEPTGPLAEAIDRDLGGFEGFKKLWSNVAGTVKGSGWVMLMFDPVGVRLHVSGAGDHDLFHLPGTFPLLPLDVWEHAYYLKYQNKRGEYVDAFFEVIDWNSVGRLYEMVSAPYRR